MTERHGVWDELSDADAYNLIKRCVGVDRSAADYFVDPAFSGIHVRRVWPGAEKDIGDIDTLPAILGSQFEGAEIDLQTGSDYSVFVSGDTISAAVPPGQVMVLELSSIVNGSTLQKFWLHGASSSDAVPGSSLGELVAPAEKCLLIHAVEKPVSPPKFGLAGTGDTASPTMQCQKEFGKTSATFVDPGFTVDDETTSRIDVLGSWTEVTDEVTEGSWPTRATRSAHLFGKQVTLPANHPLAEMEARSIPRSRAYSARSDTRAKIIDGDNTSYDFKDTKYRAMTLTAVGTSRFVEVFQQDTTDPPDRFKITSATIETEVSNSAPAKTPPVVYLVPTLLRTSADGSRDCETVLNTDGFGLRIYMSRGTWFSAGDGEQLAVLFAQSPDLGTLSQIAADPILAGPAVVNDLSPSDMDIDPQLVRHNVAQIVVANSAAGGTTQSDRSEVRHVEVCPYDVSWDPEKDMLYSDIVVRSRAAYRPFVRLALARYKEDSVDLAQLSDTVFADFVQLSPTRSLSVVRHWGSLEVALSGVFPTPNSSGKVTTKVVVLLEERQYSALSGKGFWSDGSQPRVELTSTQQSAGRMIWHGSLPLDFAIFVERRLVVEEWEIWAGQGDDAFTTGRLVYSDAYEL